MLWLAQELSRLFLIFKLMNAKIIALSIIAISVIVGGFILFSGSNQDNSQEASNVNIVDGKQIITINAKGGYFPRVTNAKADVPTIIKLNTQGTFDCSSALTIPSLGYRNNLPASGETTVDVPPQKAGSLVRGVCSMGMYSFTVKFN